MIFRTRGKSRKDEFEDIERIATFFAELRSVTGRNFVIGIHDNERGLAEDLFTIDSMSPDLGLLRRMIGASKLRKEGSDRTADNADIADEEG